MITGPYEAARKRVPAVLAGVGGIAIYQLVFRRAPLEMAALSIGQRGVSTLLAGTAWSAVLTGSIVLTRPIPVAQGGVLLLGTDRSSAVA